MKPGDEYADAMIEMDEDVGSLREQAPRTHDLGPQS
jgi:hypothetical protein